MTPPGEPVKPLHVSGFPETAKQHGLSINKIMTPPVFPQKSPFRDIERDHDNLPLHYPPVVPTIIEFPGDLHHRPISPSVQSIIPLSPYTKPMPSGIGAGSPYLQNSNMSL